MKKSTLYIMLCALLSVFQLGAKAQNLTYSDSVEISLLTCSPGKEVWAQYGHTAIRYNDRINGNDLAVNYGLFSQDQPNFILRFIFGLTDYRVGIQPMALFMAQYAYEERGVVEQVLDLTDDEKFAIYQALETNLRPENVVYRYNFFYDNCTTRAQHVLLDSLNGGIVSDWNKGHKMPTYREMIHEWNKDYQWAQFGEDLLIGLKADMALEKEEQQLFLPDNLRKYIDAARRNGRALVKETNVLIETPAMVPEKGFPLSPHQVASIFAFISAIILAYEWKTRKLLWGWDLFLMLVSGIIGLVLFAMIFSEHPCVSLNMIIFFFNPLPLLFLYRAIRKERKRERDWWWLLWGVLIVIGIGGAFFQRIPIPVLIVALSLLLNCITHHTIQQKG